MNNKQNNELPVFQLKDNFPHFFQFSPIPSRFRKTQPLWFLSQKPIIQFLGTSLGTKLLQGRKHIYIFIYIPGIYLVLYKYMLNE